MWTSLTAEGFEALGVAVHHCLQRWTALQLAVQNEWGGSSTSLKAEQFHADIMAFFTNSKERRYIDELEDLLDQHMVEFFNTEIDDGSVFDVSEQIMILHEECMQGNYENARCMSSVASGGAQSVLNSQQLPTPDDKVDDTVGNHQVGTSKVEAEDMDMEYTIYPSAPLHGPKTVTVNRTQLTEDEVADGWQQVPAQKSRRRKN